MNWKGFLLSIATSVAGAAVHAVATAVDAKVPAASVIIGSIEAAIESALLKVEEPTA